MLNRTFIFFLALALLSSCNNDDEQAPTISTADKQAVVNHYADIVYATYADAIATAQILNTTIEALVAEPTEAHLTAAKNAWRVAREPYGQSEAFRFYGGPIDDEDGPEGTLNAWPLDEAFIDYVAGNPESGIVQDATTFPTINKQLIASQNEKGGETNVSSGYHAIEFLLWGQDLSDGPGAGTRPATDYDTDNCTGGNCARRATYLRAATDLLLDNLASVAQQWAPGGTYRATFTAPENLDSSIDHMFNGIGVLSVGELAGERMTVAYEEKSKEDEHSCFSDNTHRDIVNNALGIQNVYFGSYKRVDGTTVSGPGLNSLVSTLDEELNSALEEALNRSVSAAEQIQAPFDQEILNAEGRARIKTTIDLLKEQGSVITQAAALDF